MPFSNHSHSGQFCGHAKNTLEEMVQTAISSGMEVFALTEHMPRDQAGDLYPEEIEASETPASLSATFEAYISEAARLRAVYESKIEILIGMEIDWIRPSSKSWIQQLLGKYSLDLFIGSVHHVHTIPIDYDEDMYKQARDKSGGSDERLFSDYFDAQYEMLKELKPPIVGHFDLIRLKSNEPNGSLMRWGAVWQKALRNLSFVSQYGGVLELNSAALRKGMSEPYPTAEVCKAFTDLGGRFTFSDDSHGTDQVGLNYDRVLVFAEDVGIRDVLCFGRGSSSVGSHDSQRYGSSMSLADIRKHPFFQRRQLSI